MILGIGTDILEIKRIRLAHKKWGERISRKILTEFEQTRLAKSSDKERFLARRFCAKEAISKALGTGMKSGVSFPQIEIRHDVRGAPIVKLSGEAHKCYTAKGASKISVSISDEREYSVAFAVLSA